MNDDLKLPAVLREVSEAAGMAAAMKLAQDFGGRRLYLPQRPGPETQLCRSVGPEAAGKIVAVLGSGFINVPLGPRFWNRRAVAAVAELLAHGKSIPKIAAHLGITERTVYRYRRILLGLPPERERKRKRST